MCVRATDGTEEGRTGGLGTKRKKELEHATRKKEMSGDGD